MSNAPVYFVIAQVRFNPILTLGNYLPAIQDALRKEGFPDFQQNSIMEIKVNLGGQSDQQQATPSVVPKTLWMFKDSIQRSGFVLDQVSMSYQTTEYDTFEPFLSKLMNGLSIIHEHAKLDFTERLGIRYLDAILPTGDEELSKYLSPNVLGLFGKLGHRTFMHAMSETRTQTDHTGLISRAVIYKQDVKGEVAFPADMTPQFLQVMDKFREVAGTYGIIDTDSFYTSREDFNLRKIEEHFSSLHTEIRKSFDLMVTPYALDSWK